MNYKYPVWKSCENVKPKKRIPILMKGDSGYVAPNEVLYISGYYDSDYRPLSPWIDSQSTPVSELGLKPELWCYIQEIEDIFLVNLGLM